MARTTAGNFAAYPYQYADADGDPILPEDIEVVGKALNFHRHVTGEGLPIPPAGLTGDVLWQTWYYAQVGD